MIDKRKGILYLKWRDDVLARDKYTCQHCGSIDKKLHPHHIVRWEDEISLRIEIDNGITLCTSCHNKVHHIGKIPWNKGKIMSDEQRKKLSDAKKGKPSPKKGIKTGISWNRGIKTGVGGPKGQEFTKEHCIKLSLAKTGKPSWNKGITGEKSHSYGKKWILDLETGKRKELK